jgi:hypothetical protein
MYLVLLEGKCYACYIYIIVYTARNETVRSIDGL